MLNFMTFYTKLEEHVESDGDGRRVHKYQAWVCVCLMSSTTGKLSKYHSTWEKKKPMAFMVVL